MENPFASMCGWQFLPVFFFSSRFSVACSLFLLVLCVFHGLPVSEYTAYNPEAVWWPAALQIL